MKDENGNPIGVLAHIVKTNVTESSDADMITSLNKDLDNIKINDRFSNEEILSYINPRVETNKQTTLAGAVDPSHGYDKK